MFTIRVEREQARPGDQLRDVYCCPRYTVRLNGSAELVMYEGPLATVPPVVALVVTLAPSDRAFVMNDTGATVDIVRGLPEKEARQ